MRHRQGRARRRFATATLTAALSLIATAALGPAGASAARPLETGLLDFSFTSGDAGLRGDLFSDAGAADAGVVRMHAIWRSIAASQPANPADPADPAYNFAALDAAVRDASERGLDVLLTVTSAPTFAEGPGRPSNATAGAWRPDPVAYGQFARAIASRYSGSFTPAGQPALPRIPYFQAWNEPNLGNHLAPQYEGGTATGPALYRDLLNAFYAGVKSAGGGLVITAGTGPYGDPPGGARTRPIAFWRDVLCLNGGLAAVACPAKANFDVLAHHPINTSGGPDRSAVNPDDAATPDLHNVVDVLRAAERGGTTGTPGKHEVWATELWWESKPPEGCDGVSLKKHARYVAESLHSLWRQGASLVVWLSVRDQSARATECGYEQLQAGLTFVDGSRKPAFSAFRFPFVVDANKKKLTAWGKVPAAGKVAIQVKDGSRWKTVKRVNVAAGAVFSTRVRGSSGKFRARLGTEKSLVWTQR